MYSPNTAQMLKPASFSPGQYIYPSLLPSQSSLLPSNNFLHLKWFSTASEDESLQVFWTLPGFALPL